MESHNNLPPPFIHNPWDPPPPPPPPPPFQWGAPTFPNDVFPQFHPFHSPPHHSFAPPPGNFCPPKPNFPRKRKFDRVDDGSNMVKLYVCGIPRTVSQEEMHQLFEDYGNVMEVILLPNKQTGQQQEYCFVKYAFIEEAERAIAALHNQFMFPEAKVPIVVRYAEARQRQGLERSVQHDSDLSVPGFVQNDSIFSRPAIAEEGLHKLYVNGLNREASQQEIEEIFSFYGVVADIYIMRDQLKQSRGCGFVGFTQRHMAVAAIDGLNGSYVMRGCEIPLVVRFAEPKKPKNVDLRPALNPVDMRGSNMPNAFNLDNSSASMLVKTTVIKAGSFPTVGNRLEFPVSSEKQKPLQQPMSPSKFSQMTLQHSQPSQGSPKSFRRSDSQSPLHPNRTSVSSKDHQSLQSFAPASGALCRSDVSQDSIDCEWSEHICPDGCKYYFNCATCESRWEKPEEFALYEQLLKRQLLNSSCQDSHRSALEASFVEEDVQIKLTPDQSESCDFEKPQLAISCAVEHTSEQVQTETSTLGEPAFVQ